MKSVTYLVKNSSILLFYVLVNSTVAPPSSVEILSGPQAWPVFFRMSTIKTSLVGVLYKHAEHWGFLFPSLD